MGVGCAGEQLGDVDDPGADGILSGQSQVCAGRGRQGWALVTYSGGTRHSIRKLLAPSRNQW